ncbi:MAG: hypothetical protein CL878_15340 [Dehalococcoidia bacterium]|nr:hypothetical protein [Dehalococcoidia bacterium]
MIEVQNGVSHPRVQEAVLFPFDQASIPFTSGMRLHMVSAKAKGRDAAALLPGPSGAPDDMRVRFYGSVIPIGDELRMWYMGAGSRDGYRRDQLCYAVSKDGVNWEKPALGLVEYSGSKQNNLCDFRGGASDLLSIPVLYDPDDPDPDRRFKIAFECREYDKELSVAFSPDGLRWTEAPDNPVGPMLEMSGVIRFNGCYYVNGHGGFQFGTARDLVTCASYDFEHWTESTALGFQRDRLPRLDIEGGGTAGEQVHLGAGLWDRGNVILGVYDIWHGPRSGDRGQATMDLGLVISHNALHYHEPFPDFRLVPAAEEEGGPGALFPLEGLPPIIGGPALSHGQGMCNWGDETMLWYDVWIPGGVRLARWARDRLGYFRAFQPDELGKQPPARWKRATRHCITCPIQVTDAPGQVYVNVAGVWEHSEITVEVLDEQFRPLPGYSGEACIPLREPGLRQPVVWKDRQAVGEIDGPFRLRVNFNGLRRDDARLFAIYVA